MGRLIWLMGPSGSGKDSLLSALRQREHSQLLVAHRYITRDANAGSENHIALSEQEFFTRAGQNLLALSWHANGYYYGVGIEIDLWLHAGFDVLVNGAKTHARSTSGWNGRRATPRRVAISSITTEVCYSQSRPFYRLFARRRNSMPDCQLRPATADDAPIVYALICELKQAEFDHQAFHAGYLANLQDHNMRYQLAELDGKIIGMIGLHMQFHLHHARWIGEIQELVVMPQARGLKVGSQLLAWAEEIARQAGAELTELSTSVKRVDAHRFYVREGYTQSHFRFTKPL